MKVIELYCSDESDRQRTIKKVTEFRKVLFDYANKTDSEEAKKLAWIAVLALFGSAHNYKGCCVLDFCENVFYDLKSGKLLCPIDKRVLCPRCQNSLARAVLDNVE